MSKPENSAAIYATPLTPSYWREAKKSMSSLRCMVFAALMIAACVVLENYSIVISQSMQIKFTYLAKATCCLVYGPLGAILFGAAEDVLGVILAGKGFGFFPGYTLTAVLGCVIYALAFYRARITVLRIFIAKLLVNVMNVFLGSLWSTILYSAKSGKSYWTYVAASGTKNAALLIPEVIVLVILFQALLPILQRTNVIPRQLNEKNRISWF